MIALLSGRISVAKAGWLIAVFLIAWPLFVLLPFGGNPAPITPVSPLPRAPRLAAFGLAENPDWMGLPDLFAVWSGHADWRGDRTQFAYWNPGSRSYDYFFEAVRTGDKFRFRSLSRQEALQWKEIDETGIYFPTDCLPSPKEVEAVEFKTESPTHPFIFFNKVDLPKLKARDTFPGGGDPGLKSEVKAHLTGLEQPNPLQAGLRKD
jgi:hypothetical protein